MRTDRLETFADGVLAIAATLLILNVDTQVGGHPQDLGHKLVEIWPSYAGYAVSFLTIGIIWVNHHGLMAQIDRADRIFLFLNVFLLMVVAFIPFPTRLIAEHIRDDGATMSRKTVRNRKIRAARSICAFCPWWFTQMIPIVRKLTAYPA